MRTRAFVQRPSPLPWLLLGALALLTAWLSLARLAAPAAGAPSRAAQPLIVSSRLFSPSTAAARGEVRSAPAAEPPITLGSSQFDLGDVNSTRAYTHTVTNNGLTPLSIGFAVASRVGWNVSVAPPATTLTPGASANVVVSVTIPSDAPGGLIESTTLTATAGLIKATVRDTTLVSTTHELQIPPAQLGQLVDGTRVYTLSPHSGTTEFWPGVNTPTWGYNEASYLGPTLIMTRTETVAISVTNALTEVTTVHWHGLHLPGATDGGPHQEIDVGTTWAPTFSVINEAETAWYHPHPHGHDGSMAETAVQVLRGLAGFLIVRDDDSAALNLPDTYGVDDFPIVVQDRRFNDDGSIDEEKDEVGVRSGDWFLVNGTLGGTLSAPAQMVRLRVLNGANHRFLNFGFSDGRSFYQIASDNGLLNAPVQRDRFHMGPGERVEIVVNLSDAQGQTLHFVAYDEELGDTLVPPYLADDFDRSNFILFSIDVGAPTADPVTSIPNTLNDITRYSADEGVQTRVLTLTLPPAINNVTFEMETINITSTLDTREVWTIVNQTNDPHPFHIHDSPFQVVRHLDAQGNELPIPAYEQGWKDTIIVRALEQVDLVKDFSGYADPEAPFMYHCHILEHEGEGMMGQFIIKEPYRAYLPLARRDL